MNWPALQEAIVIVFMEPVAWLIVLVLALDLIFVAALILLVSLRPLFRSFG
jgi:hypothetical protein